MRGIVATAGGYLPTMIAAAWAAAFAFDAGALEAGAPGAAPLSAQQIVERNAAARGGLDAWRKVDTMVWAGHMESAHAPVPNVQFFLGQKRPNKTRFEVNAMGDKTLRVFDGQHGWKVRAAHEGKPDAKPYTSQEATFAFRAQGIDGPLIDYLAKGNTVALEGLDEIEGHKAYRLKVDLASGETDHVWIDAQSFLDIRLDRPSYAPGTENKTVSLFYRDYKATDGLQIPSIIETAAASGQSPDRMVIERVLLNAPLDEHTFARPGGRPARRPMAIGGELHRPPALIPVTPPAAPPADSDLSAPAASAASQATGPAPDPSSGPK